jgi:hypothetical protein
MGIEIVQDMESHTPTVSIFFSFLNKAGQKSLAYVFKRDRGSDGTDLSSAGLAEETKGVGA